MNKHVGHAHSARKNNRDEASSRVNQVPNDHGRPTQEQNDRKRRVCVFEGLQIDMEFGTHQNDNSDKY